MDEATKKRIDAAIAKAARARLAEHIQFVKADQHLTARREGTILGVPPPANADIGIWQKLQQDIGKQRGFMKGDHKGKWRYPEPEKSYSHRPAEKLTKNKIKPKKYKSVTLF